LLRVIGDIWAEAIDHTTEMVVGTLDNIPLGHVRFDGLIDHKETAMEKTTAKVTEEAALRILP
jgi:hypothetical protein